jgi:two-component system sensor kinase FixL
MIERVLKAGKRKVLATSAILIVITSVVDWALGRDVSIAGLYILPMMVGAVVLRPAETALLAFVCSCLRFCFDVPGSPAEITLRFIFAFAAYYISGLFVAELVRNRELAIHHLNSIKTEQTLRREAEEQLRVLVESSRRLS